MASTGTTREDLILEILKFTGTVLPNGGFDSALDEQQVFDDIADAASVVDGRRVDRPTVPE